MSEKHKYILEGSYRGGGFHYYYHYPFKWWAKLYAWVWSDDEMTFRLAENPYHEGDRMSSSENADIPSDTEYSDMPNRVNEHEQIGDLPHLRIQTEAGKEFWSYMNNNYGSSVWGRVGDGILAVEAEMRERLAEAWEEGNVHGARKCLFAADLEPCPYNPYREEAE